MPLGHFIDSSQGLTLMGHLIFFLLTPSEHCIDSPQGLDFDRAYKSFYFNSVRALYWIPAGLDSNGTYHFFYLSTVGAFYWLPMGLDSDGAYNLFSLNAIEAFYWLPVGLDSNGPDMYTTRTISKSNTNGDEIKVARKIGRSLYLTYGTCLFQSLRRSWKLLTSCIIWDREENKHLDSLTLHIYEHFFPE